LYMYSTLCVMACYFCVDFTDSEVLDLRYKSIALHTGSMNL
jgi:hypothetical protein